MNAVNRIYLYKRYERFWHWSQALLIISMMITGFEVHGTYHLFGFEKAVNLHTIFAWTLLTLWAFTIFWQFTTGEWKQYIPTLKKVDAMVRYYAFGIFRDAPQSVSQNCREEAQSVATPGLPGAAVGALACHLGFGPVLPFLRRLEGWGVDTYLSLEAVALVHTAGAFMMLIFFIAHVYLTTTGHTPTAHIKTMITGWEEVE